MSAKGDGMVLTHYSANTGKVVETTVYGVRGEYGGVFVQVRPCHILPPDSSGSEMIITELGAGTLVQVKANGDDATAENVKAINERLDVGALNAAYTTNREQVGKMIVSQVGGVVVRDKAPHVPTKAKTEGVKVAKKGAKKGKKKTKASAAKKVAGDAAAAVKKSGASRG